MNYSIEEFDEVKTKVLKYILYKKRTKQEIKQKFINYDNNLIEDIISYLEEAEYINDEEYISKAINEFIALKNLSLKEIQYKLLSKGIEKDLVENYIENHVEELTQYELNSIKKILIKKSNQIEEEAIIEYLLKKGFKMDLIKQAIDERYNEDE